jgi:hypothetical protein
VTGHDEESSTIYVDQEAMPANVQEWLASKGITVVEVDAVENYMNEELDAIHGALDAIGTDAIPGEGSPLDIGWQALLLYLFGRQAIPDGKGIFGALLRKLLAREEKKKKDGKGKK